MADDTKLIDCNIEENAAGPRGPGFYLTVTVDEETSEPVGPFDTEADAEFHFLENLESIITDIAKKELGL